MSRPTPRCPIRPTDHCSLCHPGATGPDDCVLVYLVKDDPELIVEWQRVRCDAAEERRNAKKRRD